MAEQYVNHFAAQIQDQQRHTMLVNDHISHLDSIVTKRLQSKIDGYFSGQPEGRAPPRSKSKLARGILQKNTSQPATIFKNNREKHLWGGNYATNVPRKAQQNHKAIKIVVHNQFTEPEANAKSMPKIKHANTVAFQGQDGASLGDDLCSDSGLSSSSSSDDYQPFQDEEGPKGPVSRFEALAAPISAYDLEAQLARMRKQISTTQQQQQNSKFVLQQDDQSGIDLKQLMSTERDVKESRKEASENRQKIRFTREKLKKQREFLKRLGNDIDEGDETTQYDRSSQMMAEGRESLTIQLPRQCSEEGLNRNLQLESDEEESDGLFEVQADQSGFNNRSRYQTAGNVQNFERQRDSLLSNVASPMGAVMSSLEVENNKGRFSKGRAGSQASQYRQRPGGPMTTKAQSKLVLNQQQLQRPGRQYRVSTAGMKSMGYLQRVQMQGKRGQLGVSNSHQLLFKSNRLPTHREKVMSKLTVFKKKIQIDDEQNRLGPNNKVILPKHDALYFKTNPESLLLKILDKKKSDKDGTGYNSELSSSSNESQHSYRSRVQKNDAVMNLPTSPKKHGKRNATRQSQLIDKGAARLMRQKSMAPVKDWTSTVTKRIQNSRYGVEATKKHYEREAVAKYIYNKFGVHLLTHNHQTRHEVIPLFGEHLRSTNGQIFDEEKDELQSRKSSAMRSQFVSLQRDLKKQNLPLPQQLKGVEKDKFVRKRILDDQAQHHRQYQDDVMTLSSPGRSFSPLDRSLLRANSAGLLHPNMIELRPVQPQSHKEKARLQDCSEDEDLFSTGKMPYSTRARPTIDKNMDNHEWQRTALRIQSLKELYSAKCLDLQIVEDASQFDKFIAHIYSKAKNRCLNLSNCYFKVNAAKVLAREFMMFNTMVSSYNLSFNELGDSGVSIIAEALYRTSHIVALKLDMNKIQWEGASYLAKSLCVNNSLIDLSMSSGKSGGNNRNRILERGTYELAEALSINRFLLILNLTGNGIGSEGLSYLLPAIAQSDTIQSLNLTSNEITTGPIRQYVLKERVMQGFTSRLVQLDQEFESLKPFKSQKLAEDDQKENKRYKLQTAFLIKEFLQKTRSLREFTLKSNKIGDEGMTVIADALAGVNSSLETLDLSQTGITAESFRSVLVSLRTNHRLSTLIADKNNLNTTYSFLPINHIVATNNTIKTLSCAHCNLTDTFGAVFAEALKTNRRLTKVNLFGNEMTCRTLTLLAQALKETIGSLVELNLGKNLFKDKGGAKLGEALRSNTSLSKLNLSDNNFTDETALALNRNLLYHRQLHELNLQKNLINIRVIESVEQTLAKIREAKQQEELPNQLKAKEQYKDDREVARITNHEIEKVKVIKQKIFRQKDRVEGHFQQIKMRYAVRLHNLREQSRELDPIDAEVTDMMLYTQYQKREIATEMEIHTRNKEKSLERLQERVAYLDTKLKKEELHYQMLKGEYETKRDLAQRELNGVLQHQEVLKSTITRRTKEVEALKKLVLSRGSRAGFQEQSSSFVGSRRVTSMNRRATVTSMTAMRRDTVPDHNSASLQAFTATPRREASHNLKGSVGLNSKQYQSEKSLLKLKEVSKPAGAQQKKKRADRSAQKSRAISNRMSRLGNKN